MGSGSVFKSLFPQIYASLGVVNRHWEVWNFREVIKQLAICIPLCSINAAAGPLLAFRFRVSLLAFSFRVS